MAIEAWDKFGELLAIVWQFKETYGDLQKKERKEEKKNATSESFQRLFGRIWQFSVTNTAWKLGRLTNQLRLGELGALLRLGSQNKKRNNLSKQVEALGLLLRVFYNSCQESWQLIAGFGNLWRFMAQLCRHGEPTLQWKPARASTSIEAWKTTPKAKQLVVVYGSLWKLIAQLLMSGEPALQQRN